MELECYKYNEKMSAEGAVCRHPDDYCKFRTSCIICFLGKENKKKGSSENSVKNKEETGNKTAEK